MDSLPALGGDESSRLARQVAGRFDAPAYVRRARLLDDNLAAILRHGEAERSKLLVMVRIHLARLAALLGNWERLELIGRQQDRAMLQALQADLRPKLRSTVATSDSLRRLRRAHDELRASIRTFNARWQAYLATVDLTPMNHAIDAYNRYYVLEKECLVKSPWIARRGFVPKPPFTLADLTELMPCLPELSG